ncbi:serine hydrolase [Winogradskyella sp.]|uniref:serine hydrolase domain-containing protein n=1 Tax=Winogradskyella sp. TaxID=1883156 RepID=UPI002634538C|nr:serine hydrolase domain-containing protein [Winogradskyella sp.]
MSEIKTIPNVAGNFKLAKYCLIFLVLISVLAEKAFAQKANMLSWKDKIDQAVDEFFIKNGPGGIITVSKDRKDLYTRTFGYADIEEKDTVTVNTLFDIASCAKQFTAVSLLWLADKNIIDLNKPIQFYLPEFVIKEPIPIYSLLTHCSGLQDYSELALLARGREEANTYKKEEMLNIIYNQQNLAFSPTTSENYSNTNYAILAELIEKVSHQSFPDFVTQHILQPLNIKSSEIRFSNQVRNLNIAKGYLARENKDEKFKTDVSGDTGSDRMHGAGGMYANIQGLLKWMSNYNKKVFTDKNLIDNLLHRDTLTNGDLTKYARGIETGYTKSGYRWIQHTGRSSSTSIMLWLPDFDISIIGLFNTQEIWAQSVINKFFKDIVDYYGKDQEIAQKNSSEESEKDIDQSISQEPRITPQDEIDLPIAHLKKFIGVYPGDAPVGSQKPPSGGVGVDKIVLREAKLKYILYNGYEIDLKPINDTILEMTGVGRPIQLYFNDLNTNKTSIAFADPLVNNGKLSNELSHQIPKLSRDELQKFAGQYKVSTLARSIPIKIMQEQNDMYMYWGSLNKKSKLYYLGNNIFTTWQSGNSAMQCNLIFSTDENGEVNGLKYDGHRVWNLQFDKIK